MFRSFIAAGIFAIAATTAGCAMQHGPEGVAYSTPSPAVGATGDAGGGSLSGGSGASDGEKDKRGNTPIGMDRDGHGPATGAIVDPAGVTRSKPN